MVFLSDWLLWSPALTQMTQLFMNPSSLIGWYQTCEHAIWKQNIVPNTVKEMRRFVASLPIPGSKKEKIIMHFSLAIRVGGDSVKELRLLT